MNKDPRQLLCTFTTRQEYKKVLDEIKKIYRVNSKIFVFFNTLDPVEIFITYNILPEMEMFPKFRGTISIHRKKQTNTLYTLNAMNQIIKDENNGQLDKSFQINWKHYENSLVITGESVVKIIPIKIFDIIN